MIVPILFSHGVAEFMFSYPLDGMWYADLQLAGPLDGASPGTQTTLELSCNSTLRIPIEIVEYGDSNTSRWHARVMARGSIAMRQKPMPTFIQNPTPRNIVSSLVLQGGTQFVGSQPTLPQLNNITVPGSISRWMSLSRHMGCPMRYDFNGNLLIGQPQSPGQPVSGKYQYVDYDTATSVLTLGMMDDWDLEPGKTVFGATIKDIVITSDTQHVRAKCTVDGLPVLS